MANEAKIEFTAETRKLDRAVNRAKSQVKKFTTSVTRSGQKVRAFGSGVAKSFTAVGKSFSGIKVAIAAAAFAKAGKETADYNLRLTRLAVQANITKKQAFGLRGTIDDIAAATGQPQGELLSGIEAIVERTGNLKFAVEALRPMAKIATASGSAVDDIAAAASNLQEKMGVASKDVASVFDILAAQGKQGAFTLKNMSSLFERLLSAAQRFNIKGVEGARKFGAFLQIARRGTGSSEQAATAVERVIGNILEKRNEIFKVTRGFDILDKDQVLKPFDVVLKEIVKRTQGDPFKLLKIFGEQAIRAITPLAASFKEFGDFREFDAFIELGGDGKAIMRDFNLIVQDTTIKSRQLWAVFRSNLDKIVNEILPSVNNLLGKVNKSLKNLDSTDRLAALAGAAGLFLTKLTGIQKLAAGGGLLLGFKTGKAIKEDLRTFRGPIGEAARSLLDIQPPPAGPPRARIGEGRLPRGLSSFIGSKSPLAGANVTPLATSIRDLLNEKFPINININMLPDGKIKSTSVNQLAPVSITEKRGQFRATQ